MCASETAIWTFASPLFIPLIIKNFSTSVALIYIQINSSNFSKKMYIFGVENVRWNSKAPFVLEIKFQASSKGILFKWFKLNRKFWVNRVECFHVLENLSFKRFIILGSLHECIMGAGVFRFKTSLILTIFKHTGPPLRRQTLVYFNHTVEKIQYLFNVEVERN